MELLPDHPIRWIELHYFSTFSLELIFSIVMVMSGMMIMFIASLLNLRKMRSGWEKVANRMWRSQMYGATVLISAKQTAEEFTKTSNINQ